MTESMARAENVACPPANDSCSALPDPVPDARKTCTPIGRCTIEGTRRVIVANTGGDAWDVWLDLHTSEGRLRCQKR
jgi:hypothetical protein